MAKISPFKAIRPAKEYASDVAALPYDVYNREEAREEVKGKPYSFLHVDRAEVDLDPEINLYDETVYKKASENLKNMLQNNILIQDEKPYLFLYQLVMNNKAQTGIVSCASIDDYINNVIKKHELTREDKEKDRINHVDYCDANTGPIFLTYKSVEEINSLVDKWISKNQPIYDFVAEDGIAHRVWMLDNSDYIKLIINKFQEIDSLYIADGHHRTASAVKVGLKRRKNCPNYSGEEEFNYFLSVIFPHDQLYIMPYNRVVKDLNGLSKEEFLDKVIEKFNIEKIKENTAYQPESKGTFGLLLENQWYKLSAIEDFCNNNDVVKSLDVSILQENILTPILGIKDIRNDKRIDFVGGIRGLSELEKRVNYDMKIAFAMYPTSIEELMDISDAEKLMPPKSTWFEPKLRSGLFIHKLSD